MAFLDELAAYGDRVQRPAAGRDGAADLAALLGTLQPETPSTAAAPSHCWRRSSSASPTGRPARCTSSGSPRKPQAERRAHGGVRGGPAAKRVDAHRAAQTAPSCPSSRKRVSACCPPARRGRAGPARRRPRRRAGAPRFRAQRGRSGRQRLHDDLRLPLLRPATGPRPLTERAQRRRSHHAVPHFSRHR